MRKYWSLQKLSFLSVPKVPFQVCPAVGQKSDPFDFQKLPLDLFAAEGPVTAERAVGIEDPVTGKACGRPVHGGSHDPGSPGASGHQGKLPIGSHLSFRNLADQLIDFLRKSHRLQISHSFTLF